MYLSPDQIRYLTGTDENEAARLYNTAAANNDFSMFMPQRRTAAAGTPAPTAAPAGPIPAQWPMFRNEMERNMAIDSGTYDPNFPSPIAKAAYTAATQAQDKDTVAAVVAARQAAPLTNDLGPEGTLMAQLAGDRGDTKRVLQSLQGIDPESEILLPPQKRRSLMPYYPTTGIGGAPSEEAMSSKLEMKLFDNPEFSRLYTRNPAKAAFVYESLTGRPLKGDIESHTNITKGRAKLGTDFVSRAIANGAKYDPETGKWQVWQRSEPEASGIGVTPTSPVTRLVDTTPEQTQYFQDYYKNVTGYDHPVPRTTPQVRAQQAARDESDLSWLESKSGVGGLFDKRREMYDQRIAKEEQKKGAPLTRDEKRVVLDRLLSSKPESWIYRMAEGGQAFKDWLGIRSEEEERYVPPTAGPAQAFFLQRLFGGGR